MRPQCDERTEGYVPEGSIFEAGSIALTSIHFFMENTHAFWDYTSSGVLESSARG